MGACAWCMEPAFAVVVPVRCASSVNGMALRRAKPRQVSVLLHPLAVGSGPLLWRDWSRREHRRACIHFLEPTLEISGAFCICSPHCGSIHPFCAPRARYRLDWHERFARNEWTKTAPSVAIKLFGVPHAFAHILGFNRGGQATRLGPCCLAVPFLVYTPLARVHKGSCKIQAPCQSVPRLTLRGAARRDVRERRDNMQPLLTHHLLDLGVLLASLLIWRVMDAIVDIRTYKRLHAGASRRDKGSHMVVLCLIVFGLLLGILLALKVPGTAITGASVSSSGWAFS